jgi:hypothetical protein
MIDNKLDVPLGRKVVEVGLIKRLVTGVAEDASRQAIIDVYAKFGFGALANHKT